MVVWETRASFVMYRRFESCQEPNRAMAVLGVSGRESEGPLSELAASRLLNSG